MISVIIPVYNLGKYLRASLDSILQQTYTDLLIICVDDQSHDDSLHILREYAAKDKRIQVYISTVKRHCGGARNLGLMHAKGEYIYFFDGDDLLEPTALETLVQTAQTNNLDIVYFNSDLLNELKPGCQRIKNAFYYFDNISDSVCSGQTYFCTLMQHRKMYYCVWQQFYKTSFLQSLQLRYLEGLPHEDAPWTFTTMLSAKRVQHIPQTFYSYRIRQNSIMTDLMLATSIRGIATGLQMMHDFFQGTIANPDIRNLTLFYELRHLEKYRKNIENRFLNASDAEKKRCLQNPYLQDLQIAPYLTTLKKIKQTTGTPGIILFHCYSRLCLLGQWLKTVINRR